VADWRVEVAARCMQPFELQRRISISRPDIALDEGWPAGRMALKVGEEWVILEPD
jgi:hypothetical protein